MGCLAVLLESTDLWKRYRPNLQAGRHKTLAYPQLLSGSNSSWTAEAFVLPSVIQGMPAL